MVDFTNEYKPTKYRSLRRGLLFWFLILSLVPMSFVSWFGFQQAEKNLSELVIDRLEDNAALKVKLIEAWFNERFIDLENYSESRLSSGLLKSLTKGLENSELPLKEYTLSDEWTNRVNVFQDDLVSMYDYYDYIQNILLIDLSGNILYSVEDYDGLGTNAFAKDSPYSNTLFAQALKHTLKQEGINFSDLERLSFNKNNLSAFISAPVIDTEGKSVGVIALQLSFDRVFTLLRPGSSKSHIYQYLVNQDKHLLTPVSSDWGGVLSYEVFESQISQFDTINSVKSYTNPNGKKVIGTFKTINIQNVEWILVSEQEKEFAFALMDVLASVSLIVLLVTALIVVFVAYALSKRISGPIIALAEASRKVADGDTLQKLDASPYEELEHMGRAFNHMLDVRMIHEAALNDRTNEAQAAIELLETQRAAIDQHAVVSTTDINGLITSVNDKFCKISGYSRNELLGNSHRMIKSDIHPPAFYEGLWQTITKGKVWHGVVCNKAKDGRIYWVNNTIVPFLNDCGEPISYMSIRTDISRSKQVELALQESQKRLNLVLEATETGVWDWQVQTGQIKFNSGWLQLLGYSPRELGCSDIDAWRRLIKPSDLILSKQFLEKHWCGENENYSFELRLKHKKGHWVWIQDTGKVVEWDQNGQPLRMIGTSVDISMRKEAEYALVLAKNSAEESALAKSNFLASVSHEIRTPMNGVLGMLSLLKQSNLNSEQLQHVNVAQSSGQSLLTLINDILDFSKIEANKLDLEVIDFNLHTMLIETSEIMAYTAQSKGLELILDTRNIEESMVRGDPSRLRQILTNLVGNAIKFTSQGEILIRASVESLSNHNVELIISVSDTGIGIPEDKKTSLFDSFSQVDTSTTRQYGGTGLGLSIVKRLCLLMHGYITVDSTQETGSTFTIGVTLERSKQSAQILPCAEIDGFKVLIVDDNATNRDVIQSQLESWGITVVTASSGEQALEICEQLITKQNQEDFFDVALLDMQMPRMDGETLGKLMLADERFCKMKLIMMTSMGIQGDHNKVKMLGFSTYLSKPMNPSDLLNALTEVACNSIHSHQGELIEKGEGIENSPVQALPNWDDKVRILLVDDNHINQLVAQGVLKELGLQADVANHGKEALEALMHTHNSLPYSIILMDCQMPVMDGYEATEAIRAGKGGVEYKSIPIVAITANAMQKGKDECSKAGMDDYLSKPINPDELLVILKKYLKYSSNKESQTSLHSVNPELQKKGSEFIDMKNEPSGSIWDKDGALLRIGGNEELLKTLAGIFIRDGLTQLDEYKQAIDLGDFQEARHVTHSVKGVAANLGGLKLQKIASSLEQAAKNADTEALVSQSQEFEVQIKALLNIFEHYLDIHAHDSEAKNENKIMATTEFVAKMSVLYSRLAVDDYIDPADLVPFSHVDVSEEIQALIDQCLEKVKQFENSTAMAILKDIESRSGFDFSQMNGED